MTLCCLLFYLSLDLRKQPLVRSSVDEISLVCFLKRGWRPEYLRPPFERPFPDEALVGADGQREEVGAVSVLELSSSVPN